MSDAVRLEIRGEVGLVQWDDGKANAVSHAALEALHRALDQAEKQAKATVLVGRPGRFCAGFDLGVMRQGGSAVGELVTAGAEFALRLYAFPQPVLAACTGHALAMGAILLLAVDERIGASGDFKIGLNEVAIGMTLPPFGVEFARERLTPRHLSRATAQAEIYAPAQALEAGFLDRLAPVTDVVEESVARAAALASGLDAAAHRNTKRLLRAGALERIRASLSPDRERLSAEGAR